MGEISRLLSDWEGAAGIRLALYCEEAPIRQLFLIGDFSTASLAELSERLLQERPPCILGWSRSLPAPLVLAVLLHGAQVLRGQLEFAAEYRETLQSYERFLKRGTEI